MTSSNKAVSKKEPNIKSQPKKNKLVSSSVSPLLIVTTITSITAIALSIYNIDQHLTLSNSIGKQNIKNRTTTVKIINDFKQSILNKQQDLSLQINTELKLQQKKISQVNNEIIELTKTKRGDDQTWKLQRAAYLISMAQLTLHWDKNTPPAISLLNSADLLIKGLNNNQFIGVRQSLNNEITMLQAVHKIDITGILAKLDSLTTIFKNLPLKKVLTNQTSKTKNIILDNTKSKWRQVLDRNLAKLSKIVVIRRHNIDFKPLISKADLQLIISQLELNLKQTQWALIHRQQQIYKFNLNQIERSLKEYFDIDATATKVVLETIVKLNNKNISPTMPNINRSYNQLMEIINLTNSGDQA